MRFMFLPHARAQMEERGITGEEARVTVEEPDWEGKGVHGQLVADRRSDGGAVRVIYNVGEEEYIVISVMRRRRAGAGGE